MKLSSLQEAAVLNIILHSLIRLYYFVTNQLKKLVALYLEKHYGGTLLVGLWLKSVKFGFVFLWTYLVRVPISTYIFIYTFLLVLYQFALFCLLILNADHWLMVTSRIRLRLEPFSIENALTVDRWRYYILAKAHCDHR